MTESVVDVFGLDINVAKEGDGPPVVVFHRDTGRAEWGPFYDALAEQHTVYVPSLPGFDQSSRIDWVRSVPALATVSGHLIDKLGLEHCAAVGLGYGGWVLMEAAVACPHRFSSIVLQSPVGVKPPSGEIVDQFLWGMIDYIKLGFHDEAAFERHFGGELGEDRLELLDKNRETVTRTAWSPYMYSRELPHLLPIIEVPVLVVVPEHDAIVPASVGDEYVSLLSNASRVDLPGAGHYADLELGEKLAEPVLRFIAAEYITAGA